MNQAKRASKGFTLIELMVVATIIAILGAIALPSYTNSVRKSRRADARSGLLELAQFMERTNTLSNRYDKDSAGSAIGSATGSNAGLPFNATPTSSATKYYNLTATTTQFTFILTATPTSSQVNDTCGTLTISNTGAKTDTGANAPTTSGCW